MTSLETGTSAERFSGWKATIVIGMARATAFLLLPAAAWVARDSVQIGEARTLWITGGFELSSFLCAFVPVQMEVRARWLLINHLSLIWLLSPLTGTVGGIGGLALLIAVESALLLERRGALLYIALTTTGLVWAPLLVVFAGFPRPTPALSDMGFPPHAIRAAFVVASLSVVALIAVTYMMRKLTSTLFESEQLIVELRGQIAAREQEERRRQRAEQELMRAQKLETLGRVAGSVAHDVNNNLTVTLACVELLERQRAGSNPQKLYDAIRHAVDNATSLTRQLLTLGRRDLPRPEVVLVTQVLERLRGLLPTAVGPRIELSFAVDEGTPPVFVDASQLEQVLLNLSINARDAMPNGGTLRVSVTTRAEPRSHRLTTSPEPPANAVRIIVSDTGEGIEDEIFPNIMEPFFTTKAAGRGTGLGLAVARAFVEESHGRLCVDTELGRGTTFTLELPAAPADSAKRQERPQSSKNERPDLTNATVLIVEDDPRIRESMALELEKQGHSVLQASDGIEALERAKQASRIDLLCTDLSMPRLGGEKLLRLFGELHGDARVLVCSAYAREPGLREFVQAGHYRVLPKPFSPAELTAAVREVLTGPT